MPQFSVFPSQKGMLITTCMDPRVSPQNFWQLPNLGPGILRNAGGRATPDVLRSLHVLTAIMEPGVIAVVHYTDCGLLHGPNFSNEYIRDAIAKRVGEKTDLAKGLEDMDFGSFSEYAMLRCCS